MGHVAALKARSFAELCDEVLCKPVALALSRAAFQGLPDEEQKRVKRVRYLTPCTFAANPSPRVKGQARPCNLLFLDVDRTEDARRLLESHWATMLKGLSYVVHHTASSIPERPRLRVIVSAEAIPVEQYPLAVEWLAAKVGVDITRESLVVVQPMFLPTLFQHDSTDLIVEKVTTGREVTHADLHTPEAETPLPEVAAPLTEGEKVVDLSHLRTPLEGVTPEHAQGALEFIDPDCSMMQWIEVGAALKHQFGEEGFPLWNDWSRGGKKYTSEADTLYRWNSLKGQTRDRVPVTIRSIFRVARLRGWVNDTLAKTAFQEALAWMQADERSTEELFDHGTAKIARISTLLGETEKGILITAYKDRLRQRGMKATIPAIRRDVEKLEIETEKKSQAIPPWVAGLVFITATGTFYRPNVDRRFSPEVIDLIYSAPSLGDKNPPRTSAYLVKTLGIPQVENMLYEPAKAGENIFTYDGKPYVNIYRPTYAKGDQSRRQEAADIIEEHTQNLIGEAEYGTLFLDFFTYLVQEPGKKIRYAPVIQGTKGCGKTWFADMAEVCLGVSNVMKVGPRGVLDSSYNDWAYGHQLLVMEEIRVVGHNRWEVMDKLKPLITDNVIPLHVKFESHRKVRNITNYLLFTNYHDALAIQDDERRYFVIKSPLQTAEHIMALGGTAYFDRIYRQLRDNPGGVRAYFESRKISKEFNPDGRAPATRFQREMAVLAASPLAAAVLQAIEDKPHPLCQDDLVSTRIIRAIVENDAHIHDFSDQALAGVLRELGWTRALRTYLGGDRHQFWIKGLQGDVRSIAESRLEIL